jgi:catechol 2,3-dioxygenase-like lactoylglutathione lyase family enzyme
MLNHISLGTHRYEQAVRFYQQAFAPLGIELLRDTGKEAAFGTPTQWSFFLYPIASDEKVTAPGTHVALTAPSRTAVTAAHSAALAAAANDIFTPRLRPDISETYFGAMFHDLDGHRIEILTDEPW